MSLDEDVKLSAYWEATQSYLFLCFCFKFFHNKMSSKNYIMRGASEKNPVNKHQKSKISFSKAFLLTTFCYPFHDMNNIFSIFS